MSIRPEGKAHLHWATTNRSQPCFCTDSVIHLDVSKLTPTRETLAAIFGVLHPEQIEIQWNDNNEGENGVVAIQENDRGSVFWKLEPDQNYQVHVVASSSSDNNDEEEEERMVPINKIFGLFPGETDDEKSDAIQRLSETFYDKIWNDPNTPTEYRDHFFSRSSSAQIQAFRQFDWFHEVFGGPPMTSASSPSTPCPSKVATSQQEPQPPRRHDILLPKVMAKHTASRMSMEHAKTWLQIMNRTVQELFPNESKLQASLGLYWLHFFGFFPFTDDDRKEFRRVVFGHAD